MRAVYKSSFVGDVRLVKVISRQWLEVQVSQSFSNGNVDLRWDQGAAMATKAEGLWEPTASVSAEDIRHLQSRV
jgi:hypothetical protein